MLPGRTALDHVGLTVPNLEQAIDYFVELLGCELVFTAGPYDNVGWTWEGENAPETATVRVAVVTHDHTHNIELLEYTNKPRTAAGEVPRPSDPGGAHIAFYVEDIDGVVEKVRQYPGVRLLGEVDLELGTPISGTRWIYTLSPWGQVVEFMNYKPGLPYEESTDKRIALPSWAYESPDS